MGTRESQGAHVFQSTRELQDVRVLQRTRETLAPFPPTLQNKKRKNAHWMENYWTIIGTIQGGSYIQVYLRNPSVCPFRWRATVSQRLYGQLRPKNDNLSITCYRSQILLHCMIITNNHRESAWKWEQTCQSREIRNPLIWFKHVSTSHSG